MIMIYIYIEKTYTHIIKNNEKIIEGHYLSNVPEEKFTIKTT